MTATDVAVGLAFVAAGLAARGSLPEQVLVAAVGPAWLAGSFLIGARSLHQGVLAVALVAFPAARVRRSVSGLEGLAAVLGDVLGDPDLRSYRWRDLEAAYVDGRGQRVAGRGDRRWLPVEDARGPVAVVAHRSCALEDGPTAAASPVTAVIPCGS